jgi:hypothetical protein
LLTVNKLNLALLAALVIMAAFQGGLGRTNCAAHAQTDVCQAADDVQVAGDTYLGGALYVESTPTAGSAGEVLLSQGSSAPPEWTDFFQEIVKAADETVTATTTTQADDHFSFTAATGSTYWIEFGFRLSENISGAQDFKMELSVPSGAEYCLSAIGASGMVDMECNTTGTLTIDTPDTTESLSPAWALVTTFGTGGTVTLRWAQDSASDNTTLHENSTMRIAKID